MRKIKVKRNPDLVGDTIGCMFGAFTTLIIVVGIAVVVTWLVTLLALWLK